MENYFSSAEALAAHIAVLEVDRDELVKQEQDAALLERLGEAILRSSETVASCDTALETIKRARLELSIPDRYETTLAELERRCQGQHRTLCDRLSNAVREAEGALTMAAFGVCEKDRQLELAFRGSSAEAITRRRGTHLLTQGRSWSYLNAQRPSRQARALLRQWARPGCVSRRFEKSARAVPSGSSADARHDRRATAEHYRLARFSSRTPVLGMSAGGAASVHSELLGQRSMFADSVSGLEYESACGLARELEDVARLVESAQSLESIESCERAERIVEHWLAGTVNPDPESLSRVQEHLCFVRGRKSKLEQARQEITVRIEALRARIDNIGPH